MIKLPDSQKAYDYENAFYLTCQSGRIGKLIAHYELYKRAMEIPGSIVECGIFKGPSFARFAMFRNLLESGDSRDMIGFDVFGKFPSTTFEDDKAKLDQFIASAGDESISEEQLLSVLASKKCDSRITLVKGDILETIPNYVDQHPELKISLLHLDVDIYEPSKCVLEYLFPKLARGGILILDDYGIFPGATKAVDDYFVGRPELVAKLPYSYAPCFIIKK
jgi:hypothetical protein